MESLQEDSWEEGDSYRSTTYMRQEIQDYPQKLFKQPQ